MISACQCYHTSVESMYSKGGTSLLETNRNQSVTNCKHVCDLVLLKMHGELNTSFGLLTMLTTLISCRSEASHSVHVPVSLLTKLTNQRFCCHLQSNVLFQSASEIIDASD